MAVIPTGVGVGPSSEKNGPPSLIGKLFLYGLHVLLLVARNCCCLPLCWLFVAGVGVLVFPLWSSLLMRPCHTGLVPAVQGG